MLLLPRCSETLASYYEALCQKQQQRKFTTVRRLDNNNNNQTLFYILYFYLLYFFFISPQEHNKSPHLAKAKEIQLQTHAGPPYVIYTHMVQIPVLPSALTVQADCAKLQRFLAPEYSKLSLCTLQRSHTYTQLSVTYSPVQNVFCRCAEKNAIK